MFIASALVVLSVLMCVLILISSLGKRYSVQFEVQRKLMHMALGLVSLSFPFLFQTPLEVALVMLASFGVLISLNYVLGCGGRWGKVSLGFNDLSRAVVPLQLQLRCCFTRLRVITPCTQVR
jgi:hypothetical protein